jgi:hypothetical protein
VSGAQADNTQRYVCGRHVRPLIWSSTERRKAGARRGVAVARKHAGGRSRTCRKSGIATKHRNAGAVLGAAERDHVLADVATNNVSMLRAAVGQNILDEIVSELVTSD